MELNGRLLKVGLIFRSRSVHISVLFRIKAGLISCNSIEAQHVAVLMMRIEMNVWRDKCIS